MNSTNYRILEILFNINRLKSILLNLIELALFSMVKLICRDYSI